MLGGFVRQGRLVKEVVSHFNSRIAFVDVFVVVVDEVSVVLEFVFFAFEELVQLREPAAIEGFSIRLGPVEGVIVVAQVVVVVLHVVARVNVEVLALPVCDLSGVRPG